MQPLNHTIKLFLCGDVMTGRGIDQLLAHPSAPELHEPWVGDARDYVRLAEAVSGPLPRGLAPGYPWGEALAVLEMQRPAARIINLETAVTTSNAYWEGKGIHYRMHPDNLDCLRAAGVDVCVLANNHVLDFGYPGLEQTLRVLREAGLRPVGAGNDRAEAAAPAMVELDEGHRLWVFALGAGSSGIPPAWAAGDARAGINLTDLSGPAADALTASAAAVKHPGDLVLVSVHWGGNWGYAVPAAQRAFAHRLIDGGQVDLIHGHSSHHVKAIEVYRQRLILYGCGDLLNDYEGIKGQADYRGELGVMYFPVLETASGRLRSLHLTPTRIRRLQIRRADPADRRWLQATLNREGREFGTGLTALPGGDLQLRF